MRFVKWLPMTLLGAALALGACDNRKASYTTGANEQATRGGNDTVRAYDTADDDRAPVAGREASVRYVVVVDESGKEWMVDDSGFIAELEQKMTATGQQLDRDLRLDRATAERHGLEWDRIVELRKPYDESKIEQQLEGDWQKVKGETRELGHDVASEVEEESRQLGTEVKEGANAVERETKEELRDAKKGYNNLVEEEFEAK